MQEKKILMPLWFYKERVNEGKSYRDYFTKDAWRRIKGNGNFTGLRKDKDGKIEI